MLKEEALRYIENLKWLKGFDNTKIGVKSVAEIFDEIAEMINDAWFSVKDRLPEAKGTYLVYAPGYKRGSSRGQPNHNGIMFSYWNGNAWSIELAGGYRYLKPLVKYWTMLPEPPEVNE